MTKDQIIAKVKELGLPEGSYALIGSCPMAAAGLREAGDIDMLVTSEVLEKFRKAGWQKVHKGLDDDPLVYDVYEAMDNCRFSSYRPTLEQVLSTVTIEDGVPFAALSDVRKWKADRGQQKDHRDIALIDSYLNRAA